MESNEQAKVNKQKPLIIRYLISREFLITIAGLAVFSFLFLILFFKAFLPLYTSHGEEISVPNLHHKSFNYTKKKLENLDLEWEIIDSSSYDPDLAPMSIISQEPLAKSKVKKGRRIFLVINKSTPPTVKLPKLKDLSLHQAKFTLESWNLGINRIKYVPDIAKNTVLKVKYKGKEVKAGMKLKVGEKVDLLVGKGLGTKNVHVPRLVGKTLDEAISILHEYGLNVGAMEYDAGSSNPKGTIFSQKPEYFKGDSVRQGSNIDIYISGEEE